MPERPPAAVLPFSRSIPASKEDEQDRQSPFDGFIEDVDMSFPPGPNYLVNVQVVVGTKRSSYKWVAPSIPDEAIALDDVPVLSFNNLHVPVKAGETVRVIWNNGDSANAHTIPVIVTVQPVGAFPNG